MEHTSNFVYLIKQIEQALRPRFLALCAQSGLSAAQYTALSVLDRHAGITSSELARLSFVRAQTMAEIVDSLVAEGLLDRQHDPKNSRSWLLSLTPLGGQRLAEVSRRVAELETSLIAELSESEQNEFASYLVRMRRGLGPS